MGFSAQIKIGGLSFRLHIHGTSRVWRGEAAFTKSSKEGWLIVNNKEFIKRLEKELAIQKL